MSSHPMLPNRGYITSSIVQDTTSASLEGEVSPMADIHLRF